MRAGALAIGVLTVYLWSLLSMLTTLGGTTLLSFRLQPTLTTLLAAAGAFGFIEVTQAAAARWSRNLIPVAAVIGLTGGMAFSQDIPDVLRPDLTIAYTDTDGHGQRGDRRPPGAEKYYTEIDRAIQAATGRPRDETVVLTADYSFLSYYPYLGFQGLTSHYANPLAQFDKRAAAIESWADVKTADAFVQDTRRRCRGSRPTVFLMRRGANDYLHAAAGRGRLPQPTQRAPLHRRPGRRAVRRAALHRQEHRPVRAGHQEARLVRQGRRGGQLPSSSVTTRTADDRRSTGPRGSSPSSRDCWARCWRSPRRSCRSSRPPRNSTGPQNGVLDSVTAPLIGYVATDLNITRPLPGRGRAGRSRRTPAAPCCSRRCPNRRPRPSTADC